MQVDSSIFSPVSPLDAAPLSNTSSPASSASASAAATSAAIASTSGLGNETTFLQLLVAQIQNQDPTAPMDSTTFLTQLASFSQLEQLIGIRQDLATSATAATAAAASAAAPSAAPPSAADASGTAVNPTDVNGQTGTTAISGT